MEVICTERFLQRANIPENNVSLAAVSDQIPELICELVNNYHIRVITPAPLTAVNGAERYHADMSVCHAGDRLFYIDKDNRDLISKLTSSGAAVIPVDGITAPAPKLNVCFLGDKLICCRKTASEELLSCCAGKNISIIHTNQKYAKCSAAVVSENAVITSDESIYRACKKNNIDVLKTVNEGIRLRGYDHGFIGGCCGLIARDILAFSGNIEAHKNYAEIKAFASDHGVSIASLGSFDLYDIGGILPLMERTV